MSLDNITISLPGQASQCAANTELADLLGVQIGPNASQCVPLDGINVDLLKAGASLHWLHVKEKRPVSANWSEAPNRTESELRQTYREGQNIGLRPGLPSKIDDDYLHLIDFDVRDAAKSGEAWAALIDLWPEAMTFPTVISGSGGDSRHIYFRSPEAMPKRKLAKGEGWEIDLMGTGSQAVLPPSIHPKTGQPYHWERPFTSFPRIGADALARFTAKRAPEVSPTDLFDLLHTPEDREVVRRALGMITDADDRETWLHIGMALRSEFGDTADAFDLWSHWSRQSLKFNERDQRKTWDSFRRGGVGIGTLFQYAKAYGWENEPADYCADDFDDLPTLAEELPPSASRLTFLTPNECDASPSREYLIKGLLARGDVGCIFGAPGAGKSLAGPFLGFMVALGKSAFGMRTRQGKVFYVAAEDHSGMLGRVKALKREHGSADAFKLVGGISRLLPAAGEKRAPDLQALLDAVEAQRPDLIFIDTLAVAFGSFDENSAEPMNQIVRIARALATRGAAVVLIHHDTKSESGTPRGHSVLNGALDVALHVKKDAEAGIIRGKLTKSRNGSCERDIAFTIASDTFGFDDDGDPLNFPRCNPLVGLPPKDKKLTPAQRAALDVLEQAGGGLSEEEYVSRLMEGRDVSASPSSKSRRDAATRALRDLRKMSRINFAGGIYTLCDGFDALSLPKAARPEEPPLLLN